MKINNIQSLPLIMDIGMNNGRDSLFYLQKGYRVVAVEANPLLVNRAEEKLKEYLSTGQFIIEPVGLLPSGGLFPFYLNLDNDHWSSFDKDWGTRNGSQFQKVSVQCITPSMLFEKHGIPYYLKIDIEGNDIDVVRALHNFSDRPKYISIEEHEAYYFAELWAVGCRKYKIVNQHTLDQVHCPNPPLEGNYVNAVFDGTTSGPFGEEAPGEWMPFDIAIEKYLTEIRSPTRGYLSGNDWYDIHGYIGNSN